MRTLSAVLGTKTEKAMRGACEIVDKLQRPIDAVALVADQLSEIRDEKAAGVILTWLEGLPAASRKSVAVNLHPSMPESMQVRADKLNV